MSDNFESDAQDYLLGHMEPARKRAFEQTLQMQAAARAELKALANALASFAHETAAPESLGAADHRIVLEALRAETEGTGPVRPRRRLRWLNLAWPLAAAILLALNFVDFHRPLPSVALHRGSRPPAPAATASTAGGPAGASDRNAGAPAAGGSARMALAGTAASPADRSRDAEVQRLRASLAEAQQANEALRVAYDALVRNLGGGTAPIDKPLDRLSTMELVDNASFTAGQRHGLASIGRSILTEPGIVVPTDSGPPPGASTSAGAEQPYAWSVYDEKDHRGYLNVYHVPAPTIDQVLQVWVRTPDAAAYQPVATVPYRNGSGTTQYTLPATSAAPAEILVTLEPQNATPTAPTGPVVVRGP